MLVALPLLSFPLILAFVGIRFGTCCDGFRGSFLVTAVTWGVLVTISTELLSAINSISLTHIATFWAVIDILACSAVIATIRSRRYFQHNPTNTPCYLDTLLLVLIGLIVAMVGIIALVASPNNTDSMIYHMSRVVHWIQNNNVAFYPTHILRQNHQTPWAEFAIMHLQILSGGDRLANLVQWFSMVASVVGVSLLARMFGGGRRIQIFASVVCVSIPMGILQSTSTQNDYVLSLWIVCFVLFLFRLRRDRRTFNALAAGAALGLALLTKATSYVFVFPFILWWVISNFSKDKNKLTVFLRHALIIASIAFSMNISYYVRNYQLYGHPLGPGKESPQAIYTNEQISFAGTTANVVRNLGLHISTPWHRINAAIETLIYVLLGKEVNNPATTWAGTSFHVSVTSFNENSAQNVLHLIAIILSLLVVFLVKGQWENKDFVTCSLLLTGSFLLFCVLLRWQQWHSRLHLPIFVIASPLVSIALSRLTTPKSQAVIAFVFFLGAIPWVIKNQHRPLLGPQNIFNTNRADQYFVNRPVLKNPYMKAVDFVSQSKISTLGMILRGDDFEYPLWRLFKDRYDGTCHIQHVKVSNISKNLVTDDFSPEAIISTRRIDQINLSKQSYYRAWQQDRFGVFLKNQPLRME